MGNNGPDAKLEGEGTGMEVSEAVESSEHVVAGSKVMVLVLVVVLVLAIALIGGGVWLVYLGAKGTTEMSIFGNTLKTQNVGVTGLFAGVVLGVVGIQRTLKALERLAALPRD
jgi:uncharacterized membrane protein